MQKNFYKGRKVIVITFENDVLLMHGWEENGMDSSQSGLLLSSF